MAAEVYSKANEAFVSDEYEEAANLYSKAIELDNNKEDYYASRSHAYLKLERYSDALADAVKALELNPKHSKAHLRKGLALFHLERFAEAKKSLEEGQQLDGKDQVFGRWIRKCEAEMDLAQNSSAGPESSMATGSSSPSKSSTSPTEAPVAPLAMPPPGPKTRYDWYQTEAFVVVTVMMKNVKKEDLKVDISERNLNVEIQLASGSTYNLDLDLLHPIVPDQCIPKLLSTKVEIKLKKAEGLRWEKLEGDVQTSNIKTIPAAASSVSDIHKYPTSRHVTKDWDKLVADIKKEEKDEKLEGDAALNQLFSQIYSDGSDEVRKAMNKSFVQSGGTVLSTNWKEVGTKDVEMKPPDGLEYKKWN